MHYLVELNPLARADLPRLSRRSFWIVVGLALAIFLIIDNPVFGDPFSIDHSILYSYLPIPVFVLVALALERKLDARTLLIETGMVAIVKFGITYVLATLLWMAAGDPPARTPDRAPAPADHAAATALDHAFTIERPGPDETPVVVSATRDEHPPAVSVPIGKLVVLRPDTPGLHTARGTLPDGRPVFNLALPEGAARGVRFHRQLGPIRVRCLVHPDERYPDLSVLPVAPSEP